ncbi:protein shisa-5-like [Lineus longissimus]|uniref:protein shisa-5-like n=1 Tax=Lineus longissimus TaxID=88925 RepID=UPI002B4DFF3B
MSAMASLLRPRCLVLVLFAVAALPSASVATSCRSNNIYKTCYGFDTYCCRWTIGGTSSCCRYSEYSYTSSVSRYGSYASTSCYNLFSYNKCYKATDSRCCYKTAGSSSSCCNYSESRFTSSLYRGTDSNISSVLISYIIGGVIGGIIFLILIIVIPIVACGACAAASNRNRRGTTVVTYNQPNQAYNNQGYNPGPPPPGHGQPPPQGPPPPGPPPGYSQAPPQYGLMYPPAPQYPPPTAVDPAYPPN